VTDAGSDLPFVIPASRLRRVIVTSTHYKPAAHGAARELADALEALGAQVILDLPGTLDLRKAADGVQLVIAVGGDGTILNTARRLVGTSLPVVGVNLGKLGFLADHSASDVREYLAGGTTDGWRLSPRMMLHLVLEGSPERELFALNDVILSQGVMTRMISTDMYVDGAHATQYRADGVVVSTPTGSTAYSLSLGGPILSQGLQDLVITPIAPHSLTDRPIVLAGHNELLFQVTTQTDEMALVVDGQERLDISKGDRFRITRAPTDFLLVTSGRRSYFDVLRHKLGWGAAPQQGSGSA
jgi:NAD+ kinase